MNIIKYINFIVFVIYALFPMTIFSQVSNPCEDDRYLALKQKSLDQMSDREYEYFTRKDEECSEYQSSISTKSKETIIKNSVDLKSVTNDKVDINGDTDNLTSNQKQRFTRERLTVEVISKTTGSAAATPIGQSVIAGYGSETTRKWKAYKGFEQISEEGFLRIAGYDKEADVVKNYISSNKTMIWGGLLAMIAGMPILGKGITMTDEAIDKYYSENDEMYESEQAKADKKAITGIVIISVGGGIAYGGLLNLGKNRYEYSTVEGIAEEYNMKLIETIKKSSP
jgi:hypothetical protein